MVFCRFHFLFGEAAGHNKIALTLLLVTIQLALIGVSHVKVTNGFSVVDFVSEASFSTIQELINKASPGETIVVPNGTYNGFVLVNKSVNLVGENPFGTVIIGSGSGALIDVTVDNASVQGFTIRNGGGFGIRIVNRNFVNISFNVIEDNNQGLYLGNSHRNMLLGNNLSRNYETILMTESNYNCFINNSLTNNYGPGIMMYSSHDNLVVGNLVNSTSGYALNLEGCQYNVLRRNTLGYGCTGIRLHNSSYNSIAENTVTNFGPYGISIERSFENNVENCFLADNELSFQLFYSRSNIIIGNNMSRSKFGLLLLASENNTVDNNRMTDNWWSFGVYGVQLPHFLSNVTLSNTVNGKAVYYLRNCHGGSVPSDAGYVAVVNSTEVQIADLNLSAGYQCVLLAYSNQSMLRNLRVSTSWIGIAMINSFNNTMTGCTLKDNLLGLSLNRSSYNRLYRNNIIGQSLAQSLESVSYWDGGYPYGGNYWSSYVGKDIDHDGIGDTQYEISYANVDHYPLMGESSSYSTPLGHDVNIVSNSTVKNFQYFVGNSTIRLLVANRTSNQDYGFCRMSIPHALMNASHIEVIIDDGSTPVFYYNGSLYDNGTCRWIYFSYQHSAVKINIIDEFHSNLILFLISAAALIAGIAYKRRSLAHLPKH